MKLLNIIVSIFLVFPTLTFSQVNLDEEYEICIEALNQLRNNNPPGFAELIDENVLKDINETTLTNYVDQASKILIKYENPKQEFVLISQSQTNYKGELINITGLSFPFPPPTKPSIVADQHIMFLFSDDISDNKLVGFRIRDFAGPARQMEEAAKSKPHLEKFDLQTENLTWIRIWYDNGPTSNEFGNESGVYALSGDSKILKKAKIDKLVSDIFRLINSAEIDSTDYKYSLRRTAANPEYVYLRMTFENYNYQEFNEFSIFTVLTAEERVDELSDGFIVIKHSEVFRYFLKVENNKELFNKLAELGRADYGELVERNP